MRKWMSIAIVSGFLAACGGGGGSDSTTPPVSSLPVPSPIPSGTALISVTPSPASAYWGYATQLTAVAKDNRGGTVPVSVGNWSVMDSAIASVTELGLLTHVSPGVTSVVATVNGTTGTAEVRTLGFLAKSLQTSREDSCVLSEDELDAWCWGNGYPISKNRLDIFKSEYPNAVRVDRGAIPAGKKITQVVPGFEYSCVLAETNDAYCWGGAITAPSVDAMGTGGVAPVSKPNVVLQGNRPNDVGFSLLKLGVGLKACALGTDNEIYCWGSRSDLPWVEPVTGNPRFLNPTKLTRSDAAPGKYSDFAIGDRSFCALNKEEIYCTNLSRKDTPLEVLNRGEAPANVKFVKIKGGDLSNGFMMVLGDDGWLYGFGGGFGRRYGNGSSSFVSDTKKLFRLGQGAIPAGVKLVDYAIGGIAGANCALGSNGKAYCWGAGYYGSLGDGQLAEHEALTPIEVQQGEVPVGVTLESIACGTYHCIALASNRLAYGWGFAEGAATGQTTNSAIPRLISRVDLR